MRRLLPAVLIALSASACSGAETEPASAEFCAVASRFAMDSKTKPTREERVELLEQLSRLGPESLRNDFDYLKELRPGPSHADTIDFEGALARTGAYMERQCHLNLPGIRTG